jgi:hypothetical protein
VRDNLDQTETLLKIYETWYMSFEEYHSFDSKEYIEGIKDNMKSIRMRFVMGRTTLMLLMEIDTTKFEDHEEIKEGEANP